MINVVFDHIKQAYTEKYKEHLKIRSHHSIGGGCISSALRLETNCGPLFLKWNASGSDDMFLREAESLNEFQKLENEFLVFPKPLLWKEIDSRPGYLLTTFLPQGRIGNDDEKLGRGLAQLHQCTNNSFGFYQDNYCGASLQNNSWKNEWLEFYMENRLAHLIQLIAGARQWSNADEALFEKFNARLPQLLENKHKPALVHGDLWSGNYMYTKAGPALIDPCVSYSDREFEFGIMSMFGGFSQVVYDAYNEYYPLEKGWHERTLIYQLYHVLNHYFLFGGGYKSQALQIMKRFI